jgi:hypothetical protein
MLCSFGLGVVWNIVWVNIKELDAWLDRRALEEKQLAETFKKSVEEIKKELDNKVLANSELNKLKQNISGAKK